MVAKRQPDFAHRCTVELVEKSAGKFHRVLYRLLGHQLHQLEIVHIPHEKGFLIPERKIHQEEP